ncbi:MAG: hypothetical protein IT208_19270 [Chthonomonadales bacterium]|nr:hypothetical protein [Chthonomonadales bacterium]
MCEQPPRPVVLAIDPGRAKCGVAIVARDGTVLHRAVIASECLPAMASELVQRYSPVRCVLGDGTGCRLAEGSLAAAVPGVPICRVEESRTSEEARARYLRAKPARGLQRLIPRGLRAPVSPYDDVVAMILAERWWAAQP